MPFSKAGLLLKVQSPFLLFKPKISFFEHFDNWVSLSKKSAVFWARLQNTPPLELLLQIPRSFERCVH